MALPADIESYLVEELYGRAARAFARYHPRFVAEHVIADVKYNGCPLCLDRAVLAEATEGLFTRE